MVVINIKKYFRTREELKSVLWLTRFIFYLFRVPRHVIVQTKIIPNHSIKWNSCISANTRENSNVCLTHLQPDELHAQKEWGFDCLSVHFAPTAIPILYNRHIKNKSTPYIFPINILLQFLITHAKQRWKEKQKKKSERCSGVVSSKFSWPVPQATAHFHHKSLRTNMLWASREISVRRKIVRNKMGRPITYSVLSIPRLAKNKAIRQKIERGLRF